MRLALAVNDISVRDDGEAMFPRVSVAAVKDARGIEGEVNHSAFEDAKDAAAVYRKMLALVTLER